MATKCPYCGTNIPGKYTVCTGCGAEIKWSSVQDSVNQWVFTGIIGVITLIIYLILASRLDLFGKILLFFIGGPIIVLVVGFLMAVIGSRLFTLPSGVQKPTFNRRNRHY
jgi:hypothetical protein